MATKNYLRDRIKNDVKEPPITHDVGAIAIIPAKIAVDRFGHQIEINLDRPLYTSLNREEYHKFRTERG